MNQLFTNLQMNFEDMVIIRRYLHEHPEASHQEVHTPAYIAKFYRELGLEVREGVGGRGVVAKLNGSKPGKTVALRADFDALEIEELNDISYKSKNPGVMHACGHDGHTATLLVLAKVLTDMQEQITGNIVFIHQHAEEIVPGGAKAMIEDGCLDGVDVIYGTHLWAPAPLGEIWVREGALMAAADSFDIVIQGKGGHGAEPQHAVDAIVIGAQFITQLQTLVSRRVSPIESAVVTVGHFVANNPFNVIADTVSIKGTVRTFNEKVRLQLKQEIENLLHATTTGMNAGYTFTYGDGYPPVINDVEETKFIAQIAAKVPSVDEVITCEPFMIAEDFSYYLHHVPGTFFITGAKDSAWEEVYPHHHAKFKFDERAMLIAASVLGEATLQYLAVER